MEQPLEFLIINIKVRSENSQNLQKSIKVSNLCPDSYRQYSRYYINSSKMENEQVRLRNCIHYCCKHTIRLGCSFNRVLP